MVLAAVNAVYWRHADAGGTVCFPLFTADSGRYYPYLKTELATDRMHGSGMCCSLADLARRLVCCVGGFLATGWERVNAMSVTCWPRKSSFYIRCFAIERHKRLGSGSVLFSSRC